jgi:hypothetical protein
VVGPKCLFLVATFDPSAVEGIICIGAIRPLLPGAVDTSPVALLRLTATGEDRKAAPTSPFEHREAFLIGEAAGTAGSDAVIPI